ncbi:MAG: hypothetical protein U0401_22975 [Anaerolineae bacterium]
MARRRPKQSKQQPQSASLKRRNLYLALLWVAVAVIAALYGYTHSYSLFAEGQIMQGILIGLAYGGGAFLVILMALFLNRKMRGL